MNGGGNMIHFANVRFSTPSQLTSIDQRMNEPNGKNAKIKYKIKLPRMDGNWTDVRTCVQCAMCIYFIERMVSRTMKAH